MPLVLLFLERRDQDFAQVDQPVIRVLPSAEDGERERNAPIAQHLGKHALRKCLAHRARVRRPSLRERAEHLDRVRIRRCKTLRFPRRDVDQIGEDAAQVDDLMANFALVCGAFRCTAPPSGADAQTTNRPTLF